MPKVKAFGAISRGSRYCEAQETNNQGLKDGWEEINWILYYQNLLYILEIICIELISCYYKNLLPNHFEIEKTRKLIARKY